MADEAVNRIGAILEELGARFDLVVEAVSGFGGRLDTLRDEIFGQFAEVGGQIRFLSEQIAENRRNIVATRDDLGAEMIRLGEALGKARVEFREELLAAEKGLRGEFAARAIEFREEATRAVASSGKQAADSGSDATKSYQARNRSVGRDGGQETRRRTETDEQIARQSRAQIRSLRRSYHRPNARPGSAHPKTRAQARRVARVDLGKRE